MEKYKITEKIYNNKNSHRDAVNAVEGSAKNEDLREIISGLASK
jgi:hypothetical protein